MNEEQDLGGLPPVDLGKAAAEFEAYRALLEMEPASPAFVRLAELCLERGIFAAAAAVSERGLAHHPEYTGARLVLARALLAGGEAERAEAEFRRVLQALPDGFVARRGLGDAVRAQGRPGDALEHYEGLLELAPFDEEVRELVAALRASAPAPEAPAEAPSPPALPALPAHDTPAEFESLPEVGAEGLLEEIAAEPQAGERFAILPTGDVAAEEAPEAGIGDRPPRDALATETLASLYLRQGHAAEARAIYEDLLRVDPGRADLEEKLSSMVEAPPAAASAPAPPAGALAYAAVLAPVGAAEDEALVAALEAWRGAIQALRAERGRG
jgi:tetratricopeptide (TPR) repeat protein